MGSDLDKAIDAIRAVLAALQPLEPAARESILAYVFKRLDISAPRPKSPETLPQYPPLPQPPENPVQPSSPLEVHIKQLKEEKSPKSAIEMAALVAYYLSHLALEGERQKTISAKDLETYFKIAEFRLPSQLVLSQFRFEGEGMEGMVSDLPALKIARLGGLRHLFDRDFYSSHLEVVHQAPPLPLDVLAVHLVTGSLGIANPVAEAMIRNH